MTCYEQEVSSTKLWCIDIQVTLLINLVCANKAISISGDGFISLSVQVAQHTGAYEVQSLQNISTQALHERPDHWRAYIARKAGFEAHIDPDRDHTRIRSRKERGH